MRTVACTAVAAALSAPTALAWPGRPTQPPPKAPAAGAPPAAWIETQTRSSWLAYGSYCWTGTGGQAACVDMIPPQSRPDLPTVRVRRGGSVRIHLAFAARSPTLTVGGKRLRVTMDRNRRIVSFRVPAGGVLSFDVRGSGGSASYVGRIRSG